MNVNEPSLWRVNPFPRALRISKAENEPWSILSLVCRADLPFPPCKGVAGPAYLGTFVYRPSDNARGTYEVCVRGGGESFLLNSAAGTVPSFLGEGVIIEGETP